jgi:hypothetical protein
MSNTTAKQIRFREYMRDLGCCVSSEDWNVQIHHIFGRSTKVKGVGNIGEWAMLPIAWRYHDVHSNDPLNVTHCKNKFESNFGTQAELFNQALNTLIAKAKVNNSIDASNFPPNEVVKAIMEYRR